MTQHSLSIKFREFEPSDYRRLAEIYDAIFPERSRTVEEWRFYDDGLDTSKYYFKRYAGLNASTGEVLGFGEMWNPPWMFHPKKFWLDGWVDPKHQGRGVGTALFERLERDMRSLGAITTWVGLLESKPNSIRFIEHRVFKEKIRGWHQTINPTQVDTSKFQTYTRKAVEAGVEFSTLDREVREDPDCYKKLYELVQTAFRDVPIPDSPTDTPYDQWIRFEMKNPNLVPEGYMIAKDHGRYVGTSVVWRLKKEPRGLYQGLTGVLREYRGKGIAMALKLLVLDYAKKNGFDNIRTDNASVNTGMLAINRMLGFKPSETWLTLEKTMS
ncbi:GNAT family N-acetyltransferase [Candidatus Bathyarchaeota archaeon]|nr:GNAT family N-acetyltransferase [Candidatus Bathyarchaeota archaeon]